MRTLRLTVAALLLLFALAACGSDTPDNPRPTATLPGLPTSDPGVPAATATTPADDYPGPTPSPDGYPGAEDAEDPYPVDTDTIWIIQPFGAQCGDPADFLYGGDVDGAVADLMANGINVYQAGVVSLAVCEACDVCPTSEHFRVLIDSANFDAAAALGWLAEEG